MPDERPGFLRASLIVARKDLLLEWRTGETLAASAVFSLTVLLLFGLTFGEATASVLGPLPLVPGVLWTVLAFASLVGLVRSAQLERRQGALAGLYLAPIDRGAIFAGKALANGVKLGVLQLFVIPLTAWLFDFDLARAGGGLVLVVLLHGAGLTLVGTLFAAVAARVGRGEALLATLLLPAVTPLLISAVRCTEAALTEPGLGAVVPWLLVAAGFDALYGFLALLTFEYVLEE